MTTIFGGFFLSRIRIWNDLEERIRIRIHTTALRISLLPFFLRLLWPPWPQQPPPLPSPWPPQPLSHAKRIEEWNEKVVCTFPSYITLLKKKRKFTSYIRKFRRDRVQSHVWLTGSPNMTKYLHISSYIRKLFLIYDFAPGPFWISLFMSKIFFSFLSVYTVMLQSDFVIHVWII